jgi:hypothetical protein
MVPPHPGWAQRPSVPLPLDGGLLTGAGLAAGAGAGVEAGVEAGAGAMPQVEQ